jgi:hypothetical protein
VGAQHSRHSRAILQDCFGCWSAGRMCMPACLPAAPALPACDPSTQSLISAVPCMQVLLLTCPACATTAASPGPSPIPS